MSSQDIKLSNSKIAFREGGGGGGRKKEGKCEMKRRKMKIRERWGERL